MSNFTTRVRYLCESFGGVAHGVREIDAQIERASRTIFDFDFPAGEYRIDFVGDANQNPWGQVYFKIK